MDHFAIGGIGPAGCWWGMTRLKMVRFCIENDEFCIENDELCIENDESCIQMMSFVFKMMNYLLMQITVSRKNASEERSVFNSSRILVSYIEKSRFPILKNG